MQISFVGKVFEIQTLNLSHSKKEQDKTYESTIKIDRCQQLSLPELNVSFYHFCHYSNQFVINQLT